MFWRSATRVCCPRWRRRWANEVRESRALFRSGSRARRRFGAVVGLSRFARARRRHARLSEIRLELQAFRLRQSGRAKGRNAENVGVRRVRHVQSLYGQGRPRGGGGTAVRHADGRIGGRAVFRIRADRRHGRNAQRQVLGRVQHQPQSQIFRQNPRDGGGRRFLFRHFARQGTADVPLLLRQRRQSRRGKPDPRPVHV